MSDYPPGPVTEAPPELAGVLDYLILGETKLPDGRRIPDLGLDKKALKPKFERKALIACSSFLMCASDERLKVDFQPRISEEAWRTAMGPHEELKRVRYLAGRVAADLMRATGIGP